jgi:glycerol kinase
MIDVIITGMYRSPLADPKARGVISGLSLESSPEDLALLYLATVQSIAYGTKHLVDHCNAHGLKVDLQIDLKASPMHLYSVLSSLASVTDPFGCIYQLWVVGGS